MVVFNVWICFEAKQDLDHLLIVIHYSEVESCAAGQILVVDARVGLAKHSYHQRMIALSSPNESVLKELIVLKHKKRVCLQHSINRLQAILLHMLQESSNISPIKWLGWEQPVLLEKLGIDTHFVDQDFVMLKEVLAEFLQILSCFLFSQPELLSLKVNTVLLLEVIHESMLLISHFFPLLFELIPVVLLLLDCLFFAVDVEFGPVLQGTRCVNQAEMLATELFSD